MTDEFAAINAAAAISSSKNNAEASATGDGAEEADNKTSRDYRYDDIERWEKDYESWSKYMFVLRDLDFEFFSSFVCVWLNLFDRDYLLYLFSYWINFIRYHSTNYVFYNILSFFLLSVFLITTTSCTQVHHVKDVPDVGV